MQVLPAVRSALVMGLLDGSNAASRKTVEAEDSDQKKTVVPKPICGIWLSRDQKVFSWLLNTLSPDILAHVLGVEHCRDAWAAIEEVFVSRDHINTLQG
jgi:hypothetical protein